MFDPVFRPAVDRRRGRGAQIEVPAIPRLMLGVGNGFVAKQGAGVIDRKIDRQDVADRGLPNQTLLRGDPHAGFRCRVVKPKILPIQQCHLTGIARRLQIAHQIAKLAGGFVFLGIDRQHGLIARFASYVFCQNRGRPERLARIAHPIGARNNVVCGLRTCLAHAGDNGSSNQHERAA